MDVTCVEYRELLGEDSDSSENCGCGPLGDLDCYDPRDYETGWEGSSPGEAGDDRMDPVVGELLDRSCFLVWSCRTYQRW